MAPFDRSHTGSYLTSINYGRIFCRVTRLLDGAKILPKSSILWVGATNVTDETRMARARDGTGSVTLTRDPTRPGTPVTRDPE